MTTKDRLHDLVDQLPPAEEAEVLDYLEWLLAPEDSLTDEELAMVRDGEAEISAGNFLTLSELKRTLLS